MARTLEEIAVIAPAVWPGEPLALQPGDLTQFVPHGLALGGPFPIRPWDDPFGPSPGRFYGLEPPSADPFRAAPLAHPCGGIVYFDDGQPPERVDAMLDLLSVRSKWKDYAVFVSHAENPEEQRFLTQVRLLSRGATRFFGASVTDETQRYFQQPLSIGEFVHAFLRQQQEHWGGGFSHDLSGLFGGDGDWAKESLCFGFMVENNDNGIYRLWSRAWLVTK